MIASRVDDRMNRRSPSAKWDPRGLTRLEVLLMSSGLILITSILLSLVQQLREEARRVQCRQNLKQVALAVHHYHDAWECFPAGFEIGRNGNYLGWGWNLNVLPYMDATDLYQQVEPHLAEGIHGLAATAEFKRQLATLRCPSDATAETGPRAMVVTAQVVDGIVAEATEEWPGRLPRSSYFGNAGYLQIEAGGIQYNAAGIPSSIMPLVNAGSLGHIGKNPPRDHRYCDQKSFGGIFGQNSSVPLRSIADGTTNTFMIGERYSPADSTASAVGHGTWLGVPDCTRAQGLAMALADASVRINMGMSDREQMTGFGSVHPGGAFFVMGDGSVRFIDQTIDLVLFRELAVINDCHR